MKPVISEKHSSVMMPSWGTSGRTSWSREDDEVASISFCVA